MRVDTLLAPNPGPYTGAGTNSYVVTDHGRSVVIDPGPVIDDHQEAIRRTVDGTRPVAVLVTHTHPDHAPAANPLGERLGVPVLGFAPGPSFEPTATLADGDVVEVGGDTVLRAVHTPGHTGDHLCFLAGDVLFSGDHIIGGSTVIIEDAVAYMRSLERVRDLAPHHLHPGHGSGIPRAVEAIERYIAHRLQRERQVVDAVASGARTIDEIVAAVYGTPEPGLADAAARQVGVQLGKLEDEGRVACRTDRSGRLVVLSITEGP